MFRLLNSPSELTSVTEKVSNDFCSQVSFTALSNYLDQRTMETGKEEVREEEIPRNNKENQKTNNFESIKQEENKKNI